MVVRTKARASRALFLSSSSRISKTISFSHGDRISAYWFNNDWDCTSLGIIYHRWASLNNNHFNRIKNFQDSIQSRTTLILKQHRKKINKKRVDGSCIGDGSWIRGKFAEELNNCLPKHRNFILEVDLRRRDDARKYLSENYWAMHEQFPIRNPN